MSGGQRMYRDPMKARRQWGTQLPKELIDRLTVACGRRGETICSVVERALTKELDAMEQA